ncbi:unnamed protein product [Acanthoscelides obtectus]|nr:unnamed protein product [Acanthoscelides obtectus]CAK1674932.1 Prothoracicotropic hormone [Acanthoscelides obtectus]
MKECENELDDMSCVKKLMKSMKNTQDRKTDEFVNYMEKKIASPTNTLKLHGSSKVIPVYHTGTTSFEQCTCDMDFQLMDLGKIYYPRYLKTGVCKQNSCAEFHKCVERKYKVRVLKQRETEDPDNTSLLPKSLREYWVAETVTVAVACECAPDI